MKFEEIIKLIDNDDMKKYKPVVSVSRSKGRVYFTSLTLRVNKCHQHPEGKKRLVSKGYDLDVTLSDLAAQLKIHHKNNS